MAEPYRLGQHYDIHVYQGNRPVATFFDPEEAAKFITIMNLDGHYLNDLVERTERAEAMAREVQQQLAELVERHEPPSS